MALDHLKTIACRVQKLLPQHLDRWQSKVRQWSVMIKSEWDQARSHPGEGLDEPSTPDRDNHFHLFPAQPTIEHKFAVVGAIHDAVYNLEGDCSAVIVDPWTGPNDTL